MLLNDKFDYVTFRPTRMNIKNNLISSCFKQVEMRLFIYK